MVYEQLAIACRYGTVAPSFLSTSPIQFSYIVPYDQWLITHIDPTWKIKHLKQRIISKCLNLPFDPWFIQRTVTPNARPPSPITFAPGASPIEFATLRSEPGDGVSADDQGGAGAGDEGYEEDDEGEQDFDMPGRKIGGVKVKSKCSPTAAPPSFRARLQQQQRLKQKQEQEQQIITHTYTLFRFSTGQVLEEDFQISWYDIQPHELVELHSSFSPPTFASSLLSPMSISPSVRGAALASPQKTSPQKKKKSSSKNTTDQGDPAIPSVAALSRHQPNLYIQPYWQGWVRALRVLWRTQTVPESDEHPHPGGWEERGEGREGRDWRHGEKAEWREKWVVIHDGVVNICRNPNDPNPTRLPLSSLMALRGPEHLADSVYTKNGTNKPSVRSKPRTPEPSITSTTTTGTLRTRSLGLSTSESLPERIRDSQEAGENVPDKEPKRKTRNLKKSQKDGKQLFSTTSSPSLRNPGQDSQQSHRISAPTPTTSKPKSSTKHSENDKSRSKSLRDKDKNNKTFIPTSREEAEQVGMKVVCAKFRVVPPAAREWDKVIGDIKQDGGGGGFPTKTRRYTSTGPSLALVAASAQPNIKRKMSTGPHVVIDSDVYVGESTFQDFGDVHGRHQPQQQQPQGILLGSSRTTPFSSSGTTLTGSATTDAADSVTGSSLSHPTGFTWNLFGDVKEKEDTEGDTTGPTEFVGDVVEPLDGVAAASSSSMTTRPTLCLTPFLPATTAATISPESQNEPDQDNANSDSDSSISMTSPVFAHSSNESDLDDETFLSYGSGGGGGTASGTSGVGGTNRPRKGYRYGGYHVQVQMAKMKGADEDERLAGGVGKVVEMDMEVEVESNGSQPQEARREQEGRNEDEEHERWIALDMVNDNAFNSILRILHRHSPLPLSSSFASSQTIIGSLISSPPNISNKPKLNVTEDLHHGSKVQVVPSDTDDDGRYAASAKGQATSNKAIHPPILESLTARTAASDPSHPFCVALPYPEWRLELVNRARRAGMREIGRPLDLALHGWGREFEEMAAAARERKLEREKAREREKEIEREEKKKRRRSGQSHVSTIKEREGRVSRVVGGSEADDDRDEEEEEEEEEAIDTTQFDCESEEESDTEWLAWMTDLPRQFLVQQSQSAVQHPSQLTSDSVFTNPFSSSSVVDVDNGSGPVRPPRTQEEERLFHADKVRKLEPSAISTVIPPPSPTTTPFVDLPKQLLTLSSPSSSESLNNYRSSLGHNSTPFPGVSPMDDLPTNKGSHSRSQSRSLQHLESYRHVGSVPEQGGDGYNPVASSSSSSRQGLHHSASVDQHLSSRKNEVDSHRRNDSIASLALGKHILTNEQIMQIESEVVASAPKSSLPSHWTFPPIPIPSPPPRPTPSHTPSASTSTRPSVPPSFLTPGSTDEIVEVKRSPPSSAATRFTSPELARWSSSVGISLSTPSSPSAYTAASSNLIYPTRSSVFGSLGRSPSLLGKGNGQEKERKGFLKKRMSRDLGKEKEKEKDRDVGEYATSSTAAGLNQRPKFVSSPSPSSLTTPHRYHPSVLHDIPSSTHNNGHPYHSPSAISSARALLRRVRSGSSLRGEESANASFVTASPAGFRAVSAEMEGKEVHKKKKGPIDRIVRGFDSSLAFAEGR